MLLDTDEVDALLLTGYFGGYGGDGELAAARALAKAAEASSKPLVVQTMFADTPATATLRNEGVPVYGDIEGAARGLAALHEHAQAIAKQRCVPDLPASRNNLSLGRAGYWEARELLASAGIGFAEARLVRSLDDAYAVADTLGYPLVLKAVGLLHKSDAGGVVLGIASAEELERAFADLGEKLGADEYALERMAPLDDGVELIVGVRWDVRFGPIVLVGIGGLFAEILADVAVALAPVEADEAEELLRSLDGAALLTGARGRPAVDLAAAGHAVAALSRLAAARPDLAEIEVNPLFVSPAGAVGLDASAVAAAP
jgi:acyl-CoA synthetase (NDP forming)